MQTDFSQIGPPLFAVLVVFLVYRRLRRNFGRQPLRPVRMRVRIALLAIIGCALLPMALRSAQYLSAELGGLLAGIGLALWGAHRTRFQMVEGRLHYLPHTYTGIAVSLLFLGRLVYRLVQFYSIAHTGHDGVADNPAQAFAPGSMVRSPLTVAILYVLIGYYVCYYSLVLYKSKHLKPEDAEAVSIAPAQ